MAQWGIFNDDSADYTEEEAVEAGFWSENEAFAASIERYPDENDLIIHKIEEKEENDDDEDD